MKPFYKDEWVTIYCGNSLEILRGMQEISVDLVVTDPPYPDYYSETYKQTPIDFLTDFPCRQLIFWSAKVDFPLDYTAIHIWDKVFRCASQYERIFERNGHKNYSVFRAHSLNNTAPRAQMNRDIVTGHPSQKPRKLIEELLTMASKSGNLILDPFLGSGTTAYCAKKLNRKCIGIEIEEKYCEIAANRCSQGVFNLGEL